MNVFGTKLFIFQIYRIVSLLKVSKSYLGQGLNKMWKFIARDISCFDDWWIHYNLCKRRNERKGNNTYLVIVPHCRWQQHYFKNIPAIDPLNLSEMYKTDKNISFLFMIPTGLYIQCSYIHNTGYFFMFSASW